MESYALLRRENELEEARRLSEIQEKCPDIHRLLSQRHQMVLSSVRSVFSGKGEDPVRKMEDYNRQISDALVRAGYPADYLSPIHRCPLCQDAGYVYRDNKKEYCACLLKNYETAVREADQTASGVSFSAFDPLRFPETLLPGTDVSQREYMLLVKEKCMAYARQLGGGSVQTQSPGFTLPDTTLRKPTSQYDFIKALYDAQQESALKALEAAYEQNVIDLNAVKGWHLNALDIHPLKYLKVQPVVPAIPNLVLAK